MIVASNRLGVWKTCKALKAMTSAGILGRGAWGGGPAYVGLQPPQMPPPIVLRAAIALPSGGASFSHEDDIQYPLNVGESVYVLDVEYLVHDFVNDEIVIANINKAGAWVYKDVKQDVLWLPVDAMAPFLRTLVSLFAIFFLECARDCAHMHML